MLSPHTCGLIDWELVTTLFPETTRMESTIQDIAFHAEGNVKTHTEMAFSELLKLPGYKSLSEEDKNILEWSTILHDVGKTLTTREENGRITSRGHSRAGRDIFLKNVWKLGYKHFPFKIRHEIAGLIAMHSRPSFLLKGTPFNPDYPPEAIIIQTSQYCRNDLLITLATADTLGRLTKVKPDITIFSLYQDSAIALHCHDQPFQFENGLSRYKFLHSKSGNYHYKAFEAYRTTCHIMFGCPGAGKSTFIKQNLKECIIISTDAIRKELKLDAGDKSSDLFTVAYERFKQAIRDKKEVVWDATNTKLLFRQKPIGIAHDYNCKTIIHIIDADLPTCLKQDSKRVDSVGGKVLDMFGDSLSFPDTNEAIQSAYN